MTDVILYALVVWFGSGQSQSSFAIDGIASSAECQRLARQMRTDYPSITGTSVKCYAYRSVK